MMSRLGPVSFWVVFVVVIAVALAASLASIWLANRIRPEPASASHNQSLSPFITIVGIVYGVLLGFTVVIAWQRFSTAEQDVADEASTLATMYRMTIALPDQEQKELRE
jgi:heme/copper-type cytochrome/quinol oxidase subunit 2